MVQLQHFSGTYTILKILKNSVFLSIFCLQYIFRSIEAYFPENCAIFHKISHELENIRKYLSNYRHGSPTRNSLKIVRFGVYF